MLKECSSSIDEVMGVVSRWENGLRKCEFIAAVSGSAAKLQQDEGFELLVLRKLFFGYPSQFKQQPTTSTLPFYTIQLAFLLS
jgi:hypothetical protein